MTDLLIIRLVTLILMLIPSIRGGSNGRTRILTKVLTRKLTKLVKGSFSRKRELKNQEME